MEQRTRAAVRNHPDECRLRPHLCAECTWRVV